MSGSVFLLSPAHCGGRRAQLLLREEAAFPLALRVRTAGAPIGEVFSFLSGLYFRGKLAYARTFQRTPGRRGGVLVIVPGRGLVSPSHRVTLRDLRAIAEVGIALDEPRYRDPLDRDVRALAARLREGERAVLLGSIATDKYVAILERHLAERLHFPSAFVGRGDMSRGGLMLRCVREARELPYVPMSGATRHGGRPPKLAPVR